MSVYVQFTCASQWEATVGKDMPSVPNVGHLVQLRHQKSYSVGSVTWVFDGIDGPYAIVELLPASTHDPRSEGEAA